MTARIKEATSDHLIATWRDLLIVFWYGQTTLRGVQAYARAAEDLATANPEGILQLTITDQDAPIPEGAIRAELATTLRTYADRTRCAAIVCEGTGFRAASVRSVMTAVSLFSRPAFPHKLFGTVVQAAEFLAFAAAPPMTPKLIGAVVTEVRGRYIRERAQRG